MGLLVGIRDPVCGRVRRLDRE
ncbi:MULTISPECIES: hypothetical protein [Brevundimonas]